MDSAGLMGFDYERGIHHYVFYGYVDSREFDLKRPVD